MMMYQSMQRRWLRQMDGPTQINQWTREIKIRDSQIRGLGVARCSRTIVVICIISFPPSTPGYFWQGSSALALISPCVLSIHDGIAFGNICLAGSPTPRESPRWAVIILTSHLDGPQVFLVRCRHRQKGIWRNISVILMINIIHLRSERRNWGNSLMFQRRQWYYIRVSGTCQLVSLSNYQSLSS